MSSSVRAFTRATDRVVPALAQGSGPPGPILQFVVYRQRRPRPVPQRQSIGRLCRERRCVRERRGRRSTREGVVGAHDSAFATMKTWQEAKPSRDAIGRSTSPVLPHSKTRYPTMRTKLTINRRALLGALAVSPVVLAAGSGRAAESLPRMTVTMDPSCGCCGAWIEHVQAAGFPVDVVQSSQVYQLKTRVGVPAELASCHTAQVGG